MTDDLRARIAQALEECRVLTPNAQADAVMAVVQPEIDNGVLDYLRTHPDYTRDLMRAEMGRLGRRNNEPAGGRAA